MLAGPARRYNGAVGFPSTRRPEDAPLLVGPVFTREFVTTPRRLRFYVSRAVYVFTLLVLIVTAWMVLTGTQAVRNVGDLARFGAVMFGILAPLQMTIAVFGAAVLTSSAVAQEKDRKTLVLLLLTDLTNSELVLGKLLASLLQVLVMLFAALPLFLLATLFGGVGFSQVLAVFAVTAASAVVAGSLGSTLALWREKTFQTLAITALVLVIWTAVWGAVSSGLFGESRGGISAATLAACFSPWHATLAAMRPLAAQSSNVPLVSNPVTAFLLVAAGFATLINLWGIVRVRAWNPSRELHARVEETDATIDAGGSRSVHSAGGKTRTVWQRPILWREVCTWAYGRKVLLVRLTYLALFVMAAVAVQRMLTAPGLATRANLTATLAPLFVLSLVLINALAVTSITTERDGKALDLLLVTDLTPPEFIFGKLGGIVFNAKEMILAPIGLCIYLMVAGVLTGENLVYLVAGLLVFDLFSAVLGIHVGMMHTNSRYAVAVSLGTLFFLCVGIATCIRIMVSFSGSFELQLIPFLAVMAGGGVGMYLALGLRNPSPAIGWASFLCPVFTFVAITSFLQQETLGVFAVLAATYGFTTAAMLIPAVTEFDVATGRTTTGGE